MFKPGNTNLPKIISILPVLLKCLSGERAVHLEDNSRLNMAFRNYRSTASLLCDTIRQELNNVKLGRAVYIAFDSYPSCFFALETLSFGVKGEELSWISWLNNNEKSVPEHIFLWSTARVGLFSFCNIPSTILRNMQDSPKTYNMQTVVFRIRLQVQTNCKQLNGTH